MTETAGDVAVIGAIATLITAMVALIAALWQGARTRAELGHVRRDAAVTKHEVTNNHGSSMRDAVDRIDKAVERLWTADGRRADNAHRIHNEIFHRLGAVEDKHDDLDHRLRRLEPGSPDSSS